MLETRPITIKTKTTAVNQDQDETVTPLPRLDVCIDYKLPRKQNVYLDSRRPVNVQFLWNYLVYSTAGVPSVHRPTVAWLRSAALPAIHEDLYARYTAVLKCPFPQNCSVIVDENRYICGNKSVQSTTSIDAWHTIIACVALAPAVGCKLDLLCISLPEYLYKRPINR